MNKPTNTKPDPSGGEIEEIIRNAPVWQIGKDEMVMSEKKIPELVKLLLSHSRSQVLEEVNRVEVIDETGRAYVKWEDKLDVELSYQDSGRTLKIFIKSMKEAR